MKDELVKGGPGGVSKGAKILSENKKNILLGVQIKFVFTMTVFMFVVVMKRHYYYFTLV